MKTVIIIPARYDSSRFPGKPLADILGKSLIRHVWEKCILAVNFDSVYIATDDLRIKNHCENQGMNVVMTNSMCLTGTDRVYEASKKIKADYYINVQGDEPLLDPEDIKKVILSTHFIKKNVLINAQCKIRNKKDFLNVNIPKVVADINNYLLYISRSAIPLNKKNEFIEGKKQVCIYGYNKRQLKKFNTIKNKTPLESIEDIEILRFLELGYKVKMIEVSNSSVAVDIPADINVVKSVINKSINKKIGSL
jgi:3-deoxy-manno-octulosonate cytidylyltransferase (CMP-KDO synthetase)